MKRKWGKCIRFPCIHKRGPPAFHSINVLLCMNHDAVPSRWTLRALLWFVDGSGGRSQFRTFSWSMSPKRQFHLRWLPIIKAKFNKRSIMLILFAISCISTNTRIQLVKIRPTNICWTHLKPAVCHPSIPSRLLRTRRHQSLDGHQSQDCIHTTHYNLQIIEELMDYFQRLDRSDPSFLLSESIQSL